MINKAFIETMIEGDANGRGFQYPIPTYSITEDFDWSDTENNRLLFEMTSKYGTPYFSNYINSDMKPSDVRSMCCRLRLDLRELRKKTGGFFGSGESTGSVGVVTINMPADRLSGKRRGGFLQPPRSYDGCVRTFLKDQAGGHHKAAGRAGCTPTRSGIWAPLKTTSPPSASSA